LLKIFRTLPTNPKENIMKSIFTIVPALILIAATTILCNGCNDKNNVENTDNTETTVPADGASADGGYYDADGNYSEGNGRDSGKGTASGSGRNSDGTPKTNKNNGYSAPDGTNAENNDGDMYTKNDTTPMPSGPPIK
jgi:hypothetical protein